MKIQAIFLFLCTLVSLSTFGRAPAVEEFVGVETKDYKELKGNERFAYDFSGDPAPMRPEESVPGSLFSVFALLAFICLPLVMWMAMNFAIETQKSPSKDNENENVSFVDFKGESKTHENTEDDVDKAS